MLRITLFVSIAGISAMACRPLPKSPVAQPEATALTGEALFSPQASEKLLMDYVNAKAAYDVDTTDVEHLIWYGRRAAYPGYYRTAINIFTSGIERFTNDARLYRHRGHRYITVREFDLAVQDLEKAAQLIVGKEDRIEPDGMPNAQNIPLTTLHSNIWYHLGLAYYLKTEWGKALQAFNNCRDLGLNDDNIVSSTHWIYMIRRRMGEPAETAAAALSPIHADMSIIENQSYWKLCRFYQGELNETDLIDPSDSFSANDAVRYGLANWHYYNGHTEEASAQLEAIIQAEGWNSFGHIAAEADLARLGRQ